MPKCYRIALKLDLLIHQFTRGNFIPRPKSPVIDGTTPFEQQGDRHVKKILTIVAFATLLPLEALALSIATPVQAQSPTQGDLCVPKTLSTLMDRPNRLS